VPGGAKSGATADELSPFSPLAETRPRTSLLEVIRLLAEMGPDERTALIEFLKTWG